jgi:Holliday junction resolvasome RuvABC ATP-dependent DNA helicase subunit
MSLDFVRSRIYKSIPQKRLDPLNVPRCALRRLGLFADPGLCAKAGGVEARLVANYKASSQVKDAAATALRAVERRLNQRFRHDFETRDRLLAVCEKLARVRLYPSATEMAGVTLAEVQEVFRPPPDVEPEPDDASLPDDVRDDDETDDTPTGAKGGIRDLATATGGDLLDDNQERLTSRVEALESALQEAIHEDEKRMETDVEIGEEEVRITIDLDHGLLGWLHSYCTTEIFGGLLQTREPSVLSALKQHESTAHWTVEPERITVLDGREMNLRQVFADWDTQLQQRGHTVTILENWDALVADRSLLIGHLDALFHFPLDWMAGHPEMATVVERYLATATRLYHQVQSQFRNMSEVDQGWAEIGLHGLLALDVMQVRCDLADERESWKAVLLPTHPLHLWRYQRLAAVLRGLGSTLDPEDRAAVIDECRRPEQFLSVIFASSLPGSRGGSRLLPISSDLHGLASFENLQNACSGLDGVGTVRYALDRFAVANRAHLSPLRVGIVNPPNAPQLVVELSKILNERRASTLPAMRLELFSTTAPTVRGRAAQALAFSSETMDLIEARLVSGRLELQIHEQPRPLDQWVAHWRQEPLHVLILFDEAGVSIRRSDMGLPMPMSPFCVRKVIRYQELRGTLRLDPTTDEPPFSEFMQLMNEADKGQRDSTPNAWADAENLRQIVDAVLQGDEPGAFWLALADRALPAESGLASVRLLARREEQRELLLLARDYRRLAEIVRPAFNRWHLNVAPAQLSKLLEEGVHLTGAGILNLVKKDGTVEANQVLGLAGTLLAARDYALRHPGSLVVSIDHQIARHWLRLGKRNERCDLIALRQDGEGVVIETIEVKSTQGTVSDISQATLDQAATQLSATLEAVADGLTGVTQGGGPLSVPRCEMLKEVLVRGCLGKHVTSQLRGSWCGWLKRIFQQEGEPMQVTVKGEIIRVALGESSPVAPVLIRHSNPPVTIRTLGESEVQRLLDEEGSEDPPPLADATSIAPPPLPPAPPPSTAAPGGFQPPSTDSGTPAASSRQRAAADHQCSATSQDQAVTPAVTNVIWPPQTNELGMIAQDETVRQLINRLHYARDFNQCFKDTMFVGSAGVGKSSFARAIADQLLGQTPIMFSGADLRNGRMIIEKLNLESKIPEGDERPVRIGSCVLFIDEVHALPPAVANILLSALDDSRLTTIDNVDYDFGLVVFLMATTDAGKLTEAFRDRPDRVLLRNYTLDELAGILWLHGRRELDDFSLSRDVCLEIAARTRARPRVAVRMLTNQLVPHFYALVRDAGGSPNRHLIGEAMTVESVIAFFESQGIDRNGLDNTARNFLAYLGTHGATAEERLRQGLGISNRGDFVEVDEYLQRLGLVTVRGGRTLTRDGRRYLEAPSDFRKRISRQG